MVTFEPMDLESQVKSAIEKLEFLSGSIEDIEFNEFSAEDLNDNYDVVINADSEVCLCIGQGDYPITTVDFLLNICEKLSESRLNESQSYAKNQNEVDFLLTVDDYDTMMILEGLERSNNPVVCKLKTGVYFWTNNVVVDNKTYEIALFKGICLYHILVEQSGNHDKYLPSYCEIAHAKANYAKKGTECPEKNKSQFSKALDKIAIRCIRWFAMQADDKRVTLSH